MLSYHCNKEENTRNSACMIYVNCSRKVLSYMKTLKFSFHQVNTLFIYLLIHLIFCNLKILGSYTKTLEVHLLSVPHYKVWCSYNNWNIWMWDSQWHHLHCTGPGELCNQLRQTQPLDHLQIFPQHPWIQVWLSCSDHTLLEENNSILSPFSTSKSKRCIYKSS